MTGRGDSAAATFRAEEDTVYWQSMPNGAGEDHWFWGGRFTAPEFRDYSFALNNISPSPAMTVTVRVRLKGRTDTGTNPDLRGRRSGPGGSAPPLNDLHGQLNPEG